MGISFLYLFGLYLKLVSSPMGKASFRTVHHAQSMLGPFNRIHTMWINWIKIEEVVVFACEMQKEKYLFGQVDEGGVVCLCAQRITSGNKEKENSTSIRMAVQKI